MLTRSDSLAQLAKAKAMAQAKFLPLGKGKSATVALKSGGSYSYDYADLAACLESVVPALSDVGIALFQPVRIEDGVAIATTMLVHGESGEWLASDYAAVAVDARDARSVGSAATYARRYGLLAMLAIASTEEDDDGKDARGGDHEMARASDVPTRPVCPVCHKDAIIASKFDDAEWFCFPKKGGCGRKWPKGSPYPTAPPAYASNGPLTEEAMDREANGLFPDEPAEDAAALLERIRERFKLVKSSIVQERMWKEHVGQAPFLTAANVDVAALSNLLGALGGK